MATTIRKKNTGSGINQSNFNNMGLVRQFIKEQFYTKGDVYQVVGGVTASFPFEFGGTARFLYGVSFFTDDDTSFDMLSVMINKELIINNVCIFLYVPSAFGNAKWNQYYELPRPLSGSDTCKITIAPVNTHNVFFAAYLSDVNPTAAK